MPELPVKEIRLPELHLPEISREEILRTVSEVRRPDLDLPRFDRTEDRSPRSGHPSAGLHPDAEDRHAKARPRQLHRLGDRCDRHRPAAQAVSFPPLPLGHRGRPSRRGGGGRADRLSQAGGPTAAPGCRRARRCTARTNGRQPRDRIRRRASAIIIERIEGTTELDESAGDRRDERHGSRRHLAVRRRRSL